MQLRRDTVGLTVDGSLMRLYVARPNVEGRWPGVLFYTDIYQLGDPMKRLVDRLAGHGFVVVAPEIFHRREPIGWVIEPDRVGRLRGNDNASKTPLADFDADAVALLSWLECDPDVDAARLGVLGFCIGGHLAFRAGLRPEVRATVCVYPTGLQDGKVGMGVAHSLQRAWQMRGALLTIFGSLDPHVPAEARRTILDALGAVPDLQHCTLLYPADHTFMRDDGERWDPECADHAWRELIEFFRKELG
jgi:carboxymethylenebutenolidase